jgi:signal transduction histidine kinase/CheY-like chemotaxis protein
MHERGALRHKIRAPTIMEVEETPSPNITRKKWTSFSTSWGKRLFHQKFPSVVDETVFRKEVWRTSRPLHIGFAIANALNTVAEIVLLRLATRRGESPSVARRVMILSISIPFSIGLIGVSLVSSFRGRPPWRVWNAVLAVVSVMSAFIVSLRSLLCFYGSEPTSSCDLEARAGLWNLPIYASLGPLLSMTIGHLDRRAALLAFLPLATLLTWNTATFYRNAPVSWFTLAFQLGAFLLGFAASAVMESDRRSLFLSNKSLLQEVDRRRVAERAAMRAQEDRTRFTNYIFHEIRVPLNTAILSLNLLESSEELNAVSTPDLAQDITRLRAGLGSVEVIINDALDFCRMAQGHFAITLRDIDLHLLIKDVLLPFAPMWKEKQIVLEEEFDTNIDQMPTLLLSDPDRIKQTVSNFLSNAIKFTPRFGHISVCTRLLSTEVPISGEGERESGSVTIEVAVIDDGVGVSEADQARLFDEFYQINATDLQGGKGTGLGLPICKSIISALGGKIGVTSTLGKGSRFFFSVPFKLSKTERPKTEGPLHDSLVPALPQPGKSRGLHILVTDDDLTTRDVMRKLLERLGHEVQTAINGSDCLNIVQNATKPFDVIFIDSLMPVMSGDEAIRHLRSGLYSNPIISLSGSYDSETKQRLFDIGASAVLLKPSKLVTIDRTLRALFPEDRRAPN